MINGYVKGQTLSISQPVVVADTIDYLEAQFFFQTSDWTGASKWAHFSKADAVYDILLDGDRITKDKHLNLSAGEWKVYLHGNVNGQRITTEQQTITVRATGVLAGEPLPEIPLSATEQIERLAEDAKEIAQSVRNDADAGRFDGEKGDPGPQGPEGKGTTIDPTLTQPNQAADAKAVGDALAGKADVEGIWEPIDTINGSEITVTLDKEPGGKPYNFDAIGWRISIGSGQYNGVIAAYTNRGTAALRQYFSTKYYANQSSYAEVAKSFGQWNSQEAGWSANIGQAVGINGMWYSKKFNSPAYQNDRIVSLTVPAIGPASVIEIYAIRAKE